MKGTGALGVHPGILRGFSTCILGEVCGAHKVRSSWLYEFLIIPWDLSVLHNRHALQWVVKAHSDGHVYSGELPIGQLAFLYCRPSAPPAMEAVEMLTYEMLGCT